jgi:branched-chain amino acid transport system ATP-binding protein
MLSMLEISNLEASYGAVKALRGVNLNVKQGKVLCLLGANGAGKSTLLNSVVRDRSVSVSGDLFFEGQSIKSFSTEQTVRSRIALVPEGRQLFGDLTVQENLLMGAYLRRGDRSIEGDCDNVYALFPKLVSRRRQLARTLSGGEQQMVAIGRALLAKPRLLLLDEPSLGLAPRLVTEILALIRTICSSGITIVLVEQNARQALRISDDACLLERGRITFVGTADEFQSDQKLLESYFGL